MFFRRLWSLSRFLYDLTLITINFAATFRSDWLSYDATNPYSDAKIFITSWRVMSSSMYNRRMTPQCLAHSPGV